MSLKMKLGGKNLRRRQRQSILYEAIANQTIALPVNENQPMSECQLNACSPKKIPVPIEIS